MDDSLDPADQAEGTEADQTSMPPLVLVAAPELTIVQAAEVQSQWLETLARMTHSVSLDLSEVSAVDSAGIQLLLALNRSVSERGLALQMSGHSAVVRSALELYGLDGRLQPTFSEAR